MSIGLRPERLLLVDRNPEKILGWLDEWLVKFDVSKYTATSGIEALEKFNEIHPSLIIISCDLPDMNGMSVSSIIKDARSGSNVKIFLYDIKDILANTKADFFFNMTDATKFYEGLKTQVVGYYDLLRIKSKNSMEIQKAVNEMYSIIPQPISNNFYETLNLFSAFELLSGDFFEYWEDSNHNLYGLLFDCPGHDIFSFSLVRSARAFLKKELKMFELGVYKKLSEIFTSVNSDLYEIDISPDPIAAIIFKVDVDTGIFHFAVAGIPGIYVHKMDGKIELHEFEEFLLGYITDPTFVDFSIPLYDVESIIVASDGLWELTYAANEAEESGMAKHDDVSGIIIKFKNDIHKPVNTDGLNKLPDPILPSLAPSFKEELKAISPPIYNDNKEC